MPAKSYIHNINDFKDSKGLWVKSVFRETGVQSITRSYILWKSINHRTKLNGDWQIKHPTYLGSNNLFEGYQEFAEWCNLQYGYMTKDINGDFWSLDKDLLIYGNKDYSPDTCMFIPNSINKLFTGSDRMNSKNPLGVYEEGIGVYKAQINDGNGKRINLGRYNCPLLAHKAWQEAKVKVILNICNDSLVSGHSKLKDSLICHINRIKNDILDGRITQI